MILLGAERYITQDYLNHETAEDYSGEHLSPIKITGRAIVTRVVNRYKAHEDSINYDDFIKNQYNWKDGDYYNCISITGKKVRYHKNELGGNCVEVQGYINNQLYRYTMFHMAKTNVQLGDVVDSNTILGFQGNTGLVASNKNSDDVTYGTHVHMEVRDSTLNFVNPRQYALGNIVITYIEQSNPVDNTKDQFVVLADKINIRLEPSVNSSDLGDVYKNENYTILQISEDSLYTWYKITTNRNLTGWVASSKKEEWLRVNKAVTPEPSPEPTPELTPEPAPSKEYILLFTCPKTDTYYLTLKEGEQLYLLKQKND